MGTLPRGLEKDYRKLHEQYDKAYARSWPVDSPKGRLELARLNFWDVFAMNYRSALQALQREFRISPQRLNRILGRSRAKKEDKVTSAWPPDNEGGMGWIKAHTTPNALFLLCSFCDARLKIKYVGGVVNAVFSEKSSAFQFSCEDCGWRRIYALVNDRVQGIPVKRSLKWNDPRIGKIRRFNVTRNGRRTCQP